jgi:hypothetical protein
VAVFPVITKGSRAVVANHRLIPILNNFSKIFGSIVLDLSYKETVHTA